ncbi:unnamed protein product [Boreogadus saida]
METSEGFYKLDRGSSVVHLGAGRPETVLLFLHLHFCLSRTKLPHSAYSIFLYPSRHPVTTNQYGLERRIWKFNLMDLVIRVLLSKCLSLSVTPSLLEMHLSS